MVDEDRLVSQRYVFVEEGCTDRDSRPASQSGGVEKGWDARSQGGTDFAVGPIQVKRNWKAAWTGRLGGEYTLYSWLTLRAGALYETSSIPDQTLQIDFVSLSRLAGTLGATARWRSLAFTAGWAHYFQQDRTVAGSQANRIDPYPAPAFPIGNGEYTTSLDIVAFQIASSL